MPDEAKTKKIQKEMREKSSNLEKSTSEALKEDKKDK